jgi:hypothetical protein
MASDDDDDIVGDEATLSVSEAESAAGTNCSVLHYERNLLLCAIHLSVSADLYLLSMVRQQNDGTGD